MDNARLSWKQRFQFSRFFKGEAPVTGPLTLTQRRVFILPTRRGMGLVLTIVLLLLTAFIYNNNLIYLLAFWLASIFFVTILHTFKALAGLQVHIGYAAAVFAGDEACFPVIVKNPLSQARPALRGKLSSETCFSLQADETKTVLLSIPTLHRGWQMLDTLTLSTSYPFGLFRAWSPLRFDQRVLVYPRPADDSLSLPQSGGEGDQEARRQGDDDFHGIRPYQRGDSLRQIHWRSYAKGQGLMTRHYADQSGGHECWLDYQQTSGVSVEERLRVLCRWVLDAEQAGVRYGLRLPGQQWEPDCGPRHQSTCLEALALFDLV